MAQDTIRKLKFDRRLLRRRGWVDPAELAKELADLPDVSQKAVIGGQEEGSPPEPGEPPAQGDNSPN
jgi:hypothetical protein